MTQAMLGWFIAGICLAAFIVLWFWISFSELSAKHKSLSTITEQVRLHRILCMVERGGENDLAAKNMLDSKLLAYHVIAKDYNALLKKPMLFIPGYILGFRSEKDDIDK